MAITLYSGTPGSGKSYRIADKIAYSALLGKLGYICNFPVDLENFSIRDIFRPLLKGKKENSLGKRIFDKLPYRLTHNKVRGHRYVRPQPPGCTIEGMCRCRHR